jgi:PAS domain S-box-containing protein
MIQAWSPAPREGESSPERLVKACSEVAAWVVSLLGGFGLLSWAIRSTSFIVPNTALGFLLAGISLLLIARPRTTGLLRMAARLCAITVFIIGALTLVEYGLKSDFGIDRLLFEEHLARFYPVVPGRPALLTAACFILGGAALLLLELQRPKFWLWMEVLTATSMMIALLALIGYICKVPLFYGWNSLFPGVTMSLPTVFGVITLGLGILCRRPAGGLMTLVTSRTASGSIARRLLLAPVFIPLVTGWVLLVAREKGFYNPEFAGWLLSFTNIFVFTLIIWWNAQLLHKAEKVREQAEGNVRMLNAQLEERVAQRTAELYQASKTLQASEARLRQIIDLVPVYIFAKNRDGLFLLANRAIAQAFGLRPNEVEGKTQFELGTKREEAENYVQADREVIDSGQLKLIPQETFTSPEGVVHVLQTTKIPFAASGTGDPAVLGISVDITDLTNAQTQVRKLNQELEQRVRDRTADLETVNKELEAFSYSVSHDLRGPLRHIDGFVDLLRQDPDSRLSENAHRFLSLISNAAKQMGKLVDDLLHFSRTGRSEVRRTTIRMNDLVEEVVRELAPECENRVIKWHISPLPEAEADPALIKQVWANLLSNAVKYTRDRAEAEITVGSRRNGAAETEFYVKDNGAGFDMQYAGKLFGVFQRLHHAEEFEGTGIGLANVRRIVQRHGGRTWANGTVGVGASVYFTLPDPIDP